MRRRRSDNIDLYDAALWIAYTAVIEFKALDFDMKEEGPAGTGAATHVTI